MEYKEVLETVNQYGLTPEQVREGLDGLSDGNIPMHLLNIWSENATNNGYLLQQQLFETQEYQGIIKPEYELIVQAASCGVLKGFQYLHDAGVGNGKKTAHFLLHFSEQQEPIKIFISDIKGSIVGDAKETLRKSGISNERIVEDIANFLEEYLKASHKEKVLHTSFGAGYGNLKEWERDKFSDISNVSGGLLMSVFKVPKTEDDWKRHLKAYGWNEDGDNDATEKASKNQVDGFLKAIGFSDDDIRNSVLQVQKKKLENGNWHIEVGFVPSKVITVMDPFEKQHNYSSGKFIKVYHSERFQIKYFAEKIKQQNKQRSTIQGDRVGQVRENNDWIMVFVERGYSDSEKVVLQKKKIKEQITLTLSSSAFLFFFFSFRWATFGKGIYARHEQKEAFEQRVFSNYLEKTKYDSIQQQLTDAIASLVITESINTDSEVTDYREDLERGWMDGVLDEQIKIFLFQEGSLYNKKKLDTLGRDARFTEYYDLGLEKLFEDFMMRAGSDVLPMDESNGSDDGLARYYANLNPLFTDKLYIEALINSMEINPGKIDTMRIYARSGEVCRKKGYGSRYLKLYSWYSKERSYAMLYYIDSKPYISWVRKCFNERSVFEGFEELSFEENQKLCKQYQTMRKVLRFTRYLPYSDDILE